MVALPAGQQLRALIQRVGRIVTATNGRQPTNALWDALDRRRRLDLANCSFCHAGDDPMALPDARAVIDDGRTVGVTFEIWECTQVPNRVHVVFPPDDEAEPQT